MPFSSWSKCTLWSRTAGYASTGTFTSPKLMAPLQIDLAMPNSHPDRGRRTRSPTRRRLARPRP